MSEKGNVAIIEGFFNAIPEGTQALVPYVHEDCVFHEAECLPWGGDFRGPAGFEEFMGIMTSKVDIDLRKIEYINAGQKVAVDLLVRWTSKRTGESVDMKVIELYDFKDGKIIDGSVYYKDAPVVGGLA